MSDDLLKSCKRCFIKIIIAPDVFWMSDYHKDDECFKKQMKHLEFLLAKECKSSLKFDEIFTGQIVSVENNSRLYRGLINDIYNKNSEYVYEIFLIDYGKIIKCCGSKIFMINNKQLRYRKSGAFKVVLHGVQPLTLDINDHSDLTNGVFQKRISSTWSVAAMQFVENQLNFNVPVYVKPVIVEDDVIFGEIYLENDGKAKPLSQMLFENDFAMLIEDIQNSTLKNIPEGTFSYNNIEDKIPASAMSKRMKNVNTYKNHLSRYKNQSSESLNSEKFSVQSLVKPILDMSVQESEFNKNFLEESNSKNSDNNSFNKTIKLNSSLVSTKIKYSPCSSFDSATHNQLSSNNVSSLPKNQHYSLFALVKRHEKLLNREQKKS